MKAKKSPIIHNQDGQLSIFLGVALLVVISIIAFIINVGLFVKSKINLQNSVDAAAYAGASHQARQLTNIGHLNWEMRNVYKEWMFKYYVLGQLSNIKNRPGTPEFNNNSSLDFRPKPFTTTTSDPSFDANAYDKYNMPSICIHLGTPHNICEIYTVPGLPRFQTPNISGISEQQKAMLNSFVKTKAEGCAVRSQINFTVALVWAYGTEDQSLFQDLPKVAAHRPGAWVKATELAVRMRNLEYIVNREPVQGICAGSGSGCTTTPSSLDSGNGPYSLNARPIKAFMTAYRNLAGGNYKSQNQEPFAGTLKLSELRPRAFDSSARKMSTVLIPSSSGGSVGSANIKHYLDLQPLQLNLVTFFTNFAPTNTTIAGVSAEASCSTSKTGLPVPGYIMGFVKNPEVMTYYGVKASAKHVGLFYPFEERGGIELHAYATAKPFGGRIGPRLFDFNGSADSVVVRTNKKSAPYIMALDMFETGGFKPGDPIPTNDQEFWVRNDTSPLGGLPSTTGGKSFYAIPNLLYDFESSAADIANQASLVSKIPTVKRISNINATHDDPELQGGLFDKKQYELFANNLGDNSPEPVLDDEKIDAALDNVRRPTRYEAMNYLIPGEKNPDANNATFPTANVKSTGGSPPKRQFAMFAPLYGPGLPYGNRAAVIGAVREYLGEYSPAIDIYLNELRTVASKLKAQASTSGNAYILAADKIGKEWDPDPAACENQSLMAKFEQFFKETQGAVACNIKSLPEMINDYFNTKDDGSSTGFPTYHRATYGAMRDSSGTDLPPDSVYTAYQPGQRQGGSDSGEFVNPISNIPFKMQRNYYSTKFIDTKKVLSSGTASYYEKAMYLDSPNNPDLGAPDPSSPLIQPSRFDYKNTINKSSELSEFTTIDH